MWSKSLCFTLRQKKYSQEIMSVSPSMSLFWLQTRCILVQICLYSIFSRYSRDFNISKQTKLDKVFVFLKNSVCIVCKKFFSPEFCCPKLRMLVIYKYYKWIIIIIRITSCLTLWRGESHGTVVNVLYWLHNKWVQTLVVPLHSLWKSMKPLINSYGLDSTTIVFYKLGFDIK